MKNFKYIFNLFQMYTTMMTPTHSTHNPMAHFSASQMMGSPMSASPATGLNMGAPTHCNTLVLANFGQLRSETDFKDIFAGYIDCNFNLSVNSTNIRYTGFLNSQLLTGFVV